MFIDAHYVNYMGLMFVLPIIPFSAVQVRIL